MDVIAENNVWDYDIPIDETIIDGNDNPAYGIVDYEPYLSPFAPPDTIIITEQYECYPWEYAYPTYLIHNSWNIYIDGAFVGNFQYGTYNLLGFGMIPGQSYLIEITLLYDEGESIPADTTFIYNPMILNPPTNVVLNPFLWIIFWEPPEYTSATLTGYNIYLDGVLEAIVDVDVFEYQYSNLIPGQQYTAGVSALYEEGESEIIEDGGWGPYIFNPPTNAFYEIIDDYIHLTWQEPEPGSTHPFLNYRIYVGGELDGETTELFYDIYDLISGQIYLVGLTAFYEYLFESDPIEFEIPYVGISTENILSVTTLHQNYPNPFKPSGAGRNPATTISFNISRKDAKRSPAFDGNAELIIYNIKGQKVKTLVNEVLPSGAHSVVWNGRDSNGNRVGSGIYFYKLQSGKFEEIKKMILLK
ncbi:MAG: hypothetical protein KAU01_02655 [Candidatus Cloacimonetes bacterium]|nr:hypothetical protein [Candidatus Cloacimonadota bacterium]